MEFGLYARPARTYGVFLNDDVEGLSGGRKEPYLEPWPTSYST